MNLIGALFGFVIVDAKKDGHLRVVTDQYCQVKRGEVEIQMNEMIILSESAELHSTERFLKEAICLGISASHKNPYCENLFLSKESGKKYHQTLVLHRTTGIRFDDFDLALSADYKLRGATVVNTPEVLHALRDKQMQSVFFNGKNVSIIPTTLFRGRPPTYENLKSIIGYDKFILKTVRGNQGIGVNIIRGEDSLSSLLETFYAIGDQKFILQPYFEDATEYRVLICREKILGTVLKKSGSESDFRKNSIRGYGKYLTEKETENNILDFAHNVFKLSGADYSGIDVIQHDGRLFLLELNLVPGFKQMEELSGKNIAKEMLLSLGA